jgi:excisionase family DNA binding protein
MATGVESEQLVTDGAVTVPAACQFTGIGRSYLYVLMEKGALRFIKIGRRRPIPRAELVRLLAGGMVGAGRAGR